MYIIYSAYPYYNNLDKLLIGIVLFILWILDLLRQEFLIMSCENHEKKLVDEKYRKGLFTKKHINKLNIGDHISIQRKILIYDHHAIYIGNGEVIEVQKDGNRRTGSLGIVLVNNINDVVGEDYIEIIKYAKSYEGAEAVNRAFNLMKKWNEKKYKYFLAGRNCEDFCKQVKVGHLGSIQVVNKTQYISDNLHILYVFLYQQYGHINTSFSSLTFHIMKNIFLFITVLPALYASYVLTSILMSNFKLSDQVNFLLKYILGFSSCAFFTYLFIYNMKPSIGDIPSTFFLATYAILKIFILNKHYAAQFKYHFSEK